jgi:hypothetical protein
MSKAKGDQKTGGRKKGTPNKVSADLRGWINALIESNREQLEADLKALEPKDRIIILEKLMQYVIPKQQSVREATKDVDASQKIPTKVVVEYVDFSKKSVAADNSNG